VAGRKSRKSRKSHLTDFHQFPAFISGLSGHGDLLIRASFCHQLMEERRVQTRRVQEE
jgi:hypothetical protein